MNAKSIIKSITPPVILRAISNLFYGWSGDFNTWAEAAAKSSGYDSELIFDKVRNSLLQVKNGQAVYERDSVLFDKVLYSFPLLAALSQVALNNNSKLNVLDFGGSLGSSYFQNRNLFEGLKEFNWCVVEQEHFVAEGQQTFANDNLHFFYNIDNCLAEYKINVVLLSSVIQYLEKPYQLLEQIISKKIEYIIIDRAPVLIEGKDRITVQTVPKNIYKAKYPCWLLNEKNILDKLNYNYDLVFDEISTETINVSKAAFKSYFLKAKTKL